MNRKERIQAIKKRIRQSGTLQLSSIAQEFDVSEMTIRRNLDEILQDTDIHLIRGTFLHLPDLNSSAQLPYSLISASLKNRTAKERIARSALSIIDDEDDILFDAGSTTEVLASILPTHYTGSVLCFSFNVLSHILKRHDIEVTVTGGNFHRSSMIFESTESIHMVRNRRVHKAFISASGIHTRLGVTCSNDYETELKRAGIQSAEQRILLIDASKFTYFNHFHFADIQDFDIIITDNSLDDSIKKEFQNIGVDLRFV